MDLLWKTKQRFHSSPKIFPCVENISQKVCLAFLHTRRRIIKSKDNIRGGTKSRTSNRDIIPCRRHRRSTRNCWCSRQYWSVDGDLTREAPIGARRRNINVVGSGNSVLRCHWGIRQREGDWATRICR